MMDQARKESENFDNTGDLAYPDNDSLSSQLLELWPGKTGSKTAQGDANRFGIQTKLGFIRSFPCFGISVVE